VFDPANPIDIRRLTIQDNIAPAPMWYLNPNSSTYNGVLTYLNMVNGSQDWCVQGNLISTGNWTNQQVNNPWPAPGDNPSAGSCHNGASNNLVGAYSTLGFMNWNSGSGGDYRLSASSVYKGAASDGKDPGADIDKVEQYIGGSASTQEPPAAPNVSFTPTSLTFGAHVVGTSSSAQTVTLQNVGSGTLNITSITASGDFHETTGCGSSLAANASCTMSVTFTPTLAGTRTGAIAIADDAPGSPHTIALSGTGLAGAGGAVTIYPATDSIPQGTKLPLMCDPGPCTYSFVGTPFGTLASNGNYTAPGSNGTATIRATSGANHADAVVTVSGTLPAMLGDCAGGGSYPHSGTTLNQCSYNHVEIGGTAQRFFDVMIPSRYVSGQSGLIVNVGLTTHRISNWCDGTQAGNETTGWGAYLNTVPSPAPVYICMEGSLILGGAHPEAWNWWGQATASWSYCAGATPCNPDEGLAARSIIQAVVRDLNLNPRKVFIVNDWNDSPAMQIGVQNADLVAGVGVWADMFFNNADASKVVQGGPNDGFSIPYPAVPISYVNLASAFNYNTQPSLNAICTSNSGTHPLNTDDIWDYLATANGITNPSCGVTGSAYQSCSAVTDQNFCTGTYNTNGVGQTTSLEAKAGAGKAGSGVLILKMAGNTSHNLPYTELGWNGEDFTVSGGPAALDMSNSACNSPTPCNRFGNTILGNTGRYGVMSSRYKWFFGIDGVSGGHGKP
jgi:Abnormal spindle-like microcephaly-assoc'd, ASPM-SPD-2-Hydin